jgi:mRNA-degrading endonuclease RelE of RelBE toxin-antitoxin system
MAWNVEIVGKARKQAEKLPNEVNRRFHALVTEFSRISARYRVKKARITATLLEGILRMLTADPEKRDRDYRGVLCWHS